MLTDPVKVVPPAAAPPPNWVAIAAFWLSIGTLVKTFYTDFRSGRRNKRADFEAIVGSPVRTKLRDLERSLATLRAFSLTNPKSLDEQKAEIEKLREEWSSAVFEVTCLLEEVDEHPGLASRDWADSFRAYGDRAELFIVEMPDAPDPDALRNLATRAHEEIRCGILDVRTALTHQLRQYDSWYSKLRA